MSDPVIGTRSPYTTGEYIKGVIDEAKISENRTTIILDGSNGKYMHGKHSWKVEGQANQEVVISQLLSKEVVEYIRNRKDNQSRGVSFSFWL